MVIEGRKRKRRKGTFGQPMNDMWSAIKSMKGKGKGKGGFQGNCERCGKYGNKAKECLAPMPAREVEEEEKSEIDWAAMVEEEAQDLNAAEEEQSRVKEPEIEGLSEIARKQVEERKERLSSQTSKKVAIEQEALAAGDRKGLEPKWRKRIDGGYRLRFIMYSGAA